MPRTIVIASGKGGVGKSTTASALGRILAEKGLRTLLCDCDAGLASLDLLLACTDKKVFSWMDVKNGLCSAEDAVIRLDTNFALLPAPVSTVEDRDVEILKEVTLQYYDDYDVIICDAPAGIGTGLMRAATACNAGIVVATADEISVKAASAVAAKLKEAGVKECRLLINRYDVKAAKKGKLLTIDDLIDRSCVRLLGIVPEDPKLMYTSVTGEFNMKSRSAKAFKRITDRILGKNIELTLSLIK